VVALGAGAWSRGSLQALQDGYQEAEGLSCAGRCGGKDIGTGKGGGIAPACTGVGVMKPAFDRRLLRESEMLKSVNNGLAEEEVLAGISCEWGVLKLQ